ncbi:MAG TPA: 3-oxoacyl-[acyl-carrier-protein] synthase III C-terminal domain-containing protein [Solirubrobacteraceae bacterium]
MTLLDSGSPRASASTSSEERPWEPATARSGPRIAGLAVAEAGTSYTQAEVLERLGLAGDEFAERIFSRAGIERRHLNLDPDYLARNTQGRSQQVEDELLAASVEAIDKLGIDPLSIGTVLSASLYSYGCPTLAHRLIENYEMPLTIDKYHLVGVGCASAVPLMRLASQALQSHPGRDVLVVAAESMSSILMPARADDPRAKTVGSAIFGDGCGVALLSGDRAAQGPAIVASQVHHIPGTHEAVNLRATNDDSYLHLARELPDLAATGLETLVESFLAANHLDISRIAHWIVHPGGRRIVESIRDALSLGDEDVAVSWQALADHGNVGTPSIFYVLRDTIDECEPAAGEYGLAITVGPGVTVGLMLLRF